MDVDLDAAVRFVATNGRLLDARRLHHLLGRSPADGVLAALDGYRNADGGYGWSLEPDLRSVTSQPVGAMHALEVLAEVRDPGEPAVRICDWLGGHTVDGGVPFALPYPDTAGSAPHWTGADAAVPSLMMTAQLAAQAHRVARRHAGVAGHPWLAGATSYCLDVLERMDEAPSPMELMFVMRFLDAAAGREPRARVLIDRLVAHVDTERPMPVAGGAEGEVLEPVEFSPYPDAYSRSAFGTAAIDRALRRLAGHQRSDGGWPITFATYSPAAAMEWRGYATVQAVAVLRGTAL